MHKIETVSFVSCATSLLSPSIEKDMKESCHDLAEGTMMT
jgi:hypothetical protein